MHHLKRLPRRHPRRFLSEDFSALRTQEVLEEGRRLLEALPAGAAGLGEWLNGRAELERAVEEERLLARLDFLDQPGDLMRRQWLDDLHQDLLPAWLELRHRLDGALLGAPGLGGLPAAEAEALLGPVRRREALYMETNLILHQRLAEVENEAIAALGAFRARTIAAEARLRTGDEAARREAWRERLDVAGEIEDGLDDLLDELHALREQIARNSERLNWTEYEAARHGESSDEAGRRACLDACARRLRELDAAADSSRPAPAPWNASAPAAREGCELALPAMLDRLQENLGGVDGRLGAALADFRGKGLLLVGGEARVPFAGCLWLPEREQPLVLLSGRNCGEELAVFLRLFATALLARARTFDESPRSAEARTLRPVEPLAVGAAEAWLGAFGEHCPGEPALSEEGRASRALRELATAALRADWEDELHARPGLDREPRRAAWGDRRLAQRDLVLGEAEDRRRLDREILLDPTIYLTDWRRACRWPALLAGQRLAAEPLAALGEAVLGGADSYEGARS